MSAYWEQFSHDEIMSMHGIDLDDTNLEREYVDTDLQHFDDCNCDNCMECLELSWKDFM